MRFRAPACAMVLLAAAPALAQARLSLTDDGVLAAGATTTTRTVQQPAPLSTPLRLGLEAGAGLVGGAAVGVFAEWGFSQLLRTDTNTRQTQQLTSLLGAPLGVAVGAPLAVTLTGTVIGERGSFLVSWLSSMGGLAVGGTIYAVATGASDSQAAKGTYALALLLPVVGAVIGYELSARAVAEPAAVPAFVPSVVVSSRGAGAGLSGTF